MSVSASYQRELRLRSARSATVVEKNDHTDEAR